MARCIVIHNKKQYPLGTFSMIYIKLGVDGQQVAAGLASPLNIRFRPLLTYPELRAALGSEADEGKTMRLVSIADFDHHRQPSYLDQGIPARKAHAPGHFSLQTSPTAENTA
jgi:hypothetical protein